jgi:hypothetical protein
MGYRQPLITIDLGEMGDGAYVTIRNPLLEPTDRDSLTLPRTASGDLDEVALHDRAIRKIAGLITDWNIWDLDGKVLPLPSVEATVMARVPQHVISRIHMASQKALSPTLPGEGEKDKEKPAA